MATLRKRGNVYHIYVKKTTGFRYDSEGKKRNIQTTIASFNLGKVSKTTASKHRISVKAVEHLILNGELNEDNWSTMFSFTNDEGIKNKIAYITIGQAIDKYLEDKELHIRKSSYDRIRVSMDRFKEVIPHKTQLKKITKEHINKFERHSRKAKEEGGFGHREGGININLTNLRTFFRWCRDEVFYLDRIPKIKISKPVEEDKYFTEAEIIEILKNSNEKYRKVFRLYLETGKRRSEIIKGELRGDLLIIKPEEGVKDKKSHSVKLNPRQVQVVRELHKDRDNALSKGYQMKSYVDRYTRYMRRLLKRLGLYDKWRTKFHSLRHSSGVIEYLETADIKAVKSKLHHTKLDMSDYYSSIDTNVIEKDFPTAYEVGAVAKKLKEKSKSDHLKCLNVDFD